MAPDRGPSDRELDRLSAPMRADVRRLSSLLGQIIAEGGGQALLDDVERLRKAAITLRSSRGAEAEVRRRQVIELVDSFEPARAGAVALAFTVFFQLANLSEERQRVRILGERSRAQAMVVESFSATLAELRAQLGDADLGGLLASLEIRPVLTAHPTEARPRAVVDALRRIAGALDAAEDRRLGAGDRAQAERRLGEQVTILWRTAQVGTPRLTPLDEVRSLMDVFEQSLFALAPAAYRELERSLSPAGGPVPAFLRFASWVGGDRDGNPHVTAAVTEQAMAIQAGQALRALEAACRRLGASLTVADVTTPPSAELAAALERARRITGAEAGAPLRPADERHREFLLLVAERLRATRLAEAGGYPAVDEFRLDVATLQSSLREAGAERLAGGELQDLAWQAQTFGFHLASLEIRQHSRVHRDVLAELVPGAEDDAPRLDRIAAGDEAHGVTAQSERAREVLATLQVMARIQERYGSEACGRYVVSFTRSAADILAVAALARLAVPDGSLDVQPVPLFESLADLRGAPAVLDRLLELPGWRRWLDARHRRLEIMLGYSDATKDAGYLAANLALYEAQSNLTAWAGRNGIELTLFHGRGGPVGRGGGPAGRAIRSQAPGSPARRLKMTEQGEVILARYGNRAIAMRHVEQVTSAVLVASTSGHQRRLRAAQERFAEHARLMAAASEAAYRGLVESRGFAEFFATVTPVQAIGELAIGSRPARRGGGSGGLDELRAIPWVFAWAQNRCNLPGWFGLGTGLQAVVEREGLEFVRRMVAGWPLLGSIVDNAEMSLAKADPMIAGLYLERGGRPDLVDRIREEYRLTRRLVLEVTGSRRLLERHPILRLATDLRNPYVDALSFLQLRFLREDRSELVRLTLGGIAAGLQNTG